MHSAVFYPCLEWNPLPKTLSCICKLLSCFKHVNQETFSSCRISIWHIYHTETSGSSCGTSTAKKDSLQTCNVCATEQIYGAWWVCLHLCDMVANRK